MGKDQSLDQSSSQEITKGQSTSIAREGYALNSESLKDFRNSKSTSTRKVGTCSNWELKPCASSSCIVKKTGRWKEGARNKIMMIWFIVA